MLFFLLVNSVYLSRAKRDLKEIGDLNKLLGLIICKDYDGVSRLTLEKFNLDTKKSFPGNTVEDTFSVLVDTIKIRSAACLETVTDKLIKISEQREKRLSQPPKRAVMKDVLDCKAQGIPRNENEETLDHQTKDSNSINSNRSDFETQNSNPQEKKSTSKSYFLHGVPIAKLGERLCDSSENENALVIPQEEWEKVELNDFKNPQDLYVTVSSETLEGPAVLQAQPIVLLRDFTPSVELPKVEPLEMVETEDLKQAVKTENSLTVDSEEVSIDTKDLVNPSSVLQANAVSKKDDQEIEEEAEKATHGVHSTYTCCKEDQPLIIEDKTEFNQTPLCPEITAPTVVNCDESSQFLPPPPAQEIKPSSSNPETIEPLSSEHVHQVHEISNSHENLAKNEFDESGLCKVESSIAQSSDTVCEEESSHQTDSFTVETSTQDDISEGTESQVDIPECFGGFIPMDHFNKNTLGSDVNEEGAHVCSFQSIPQKNQEELTPLEVLIPAGNNPESDDLNMECSTKSFTSEDALLYCQRIKEKDDLTNTEVVSAGASSCLSNTSEDVLSRKMLVEQLSAKLNKKELEKLTTKAHNKAKLLVKKFVKSSSINQNKLSGIAKENFEKNFALKVRVVQDVFMKYGLRKLNAKSLKTGYNQAIKRLKEERSKKIQRLLSPTTEPKSWTASNAAVSDGNEEMEGKKELEQKLDKSLRQSCSAWSIQRKGLDGRKEMFGWGESTSNSPKLKRNE
ncbi:hypothetical protein TUBRATIS_12890 [Tubulinosema ratisbonensis]|uniref:Uncharacterized protein n=1 Tax=Tubulinosema ratisbonensis TaxID=291195 RepID=A0A437ALZ9_9MICR|nr:hypothetical protein TUBRATIS_12890 [Tubulinosema ratisbonensis]